MEQISIQPSQWQVDEGLVRDNATGKEMPCRMFVFTVPGSDRVYVFPQPLEEAKMLGQVAAADDLEAAMESVNARRRLTVAGQPTDDEIARVARLKQELTGGV